MKEPTLQHSINSSTETYDTSFSWDNIQWRTLSINHKPSDGRLNTSFRFGGLLKHSSIAFAPLEQPLTLSDIIPPPEQARSISDSSMTLDDPEDESVLRSIYTKLLATTPPVLVFEPIRAKALINRIVEACIRLCRVIYRVSVLPDSIPLMKFVGGFRIQ